MQAGGNITFKAVQPGTAIFDGEACEDKAAFVLRGQGSVVDGIVFRNIRVPTATAPASAPRWAI